MQRSTLTNRPSLYQACLAAEQFADALHAQCKSSERTGKPFLLVHIAGSAASNSAHEALLARLLLFENCIAQQTPEHAFELLLANESAIQARRLIVELQKHSKTSGVDLRVGMAEFPADACMPLTLSAIARSRMQSGVVGELDYPVSVLLEPKLVQLYATAKSVAVGNISVFISGETGSGKEVLAQSIHRMSLRAARPFLALNCAALSETLLESELFGHEKGAFTGAAQTKTGLLESASGGTVFLDEVGEMPSTLQAKLLRVMEERSVTRVGGLRPTPIDVRFVSATHRNLYGEVQRGGFRRDLYYRLNGVTLGIPPLRERQAEIEPLARMFCARMAGECGMSAIPNFSYAALECLLEHDWPGNIRELRNVVERAVLLCRSEVIQREHLGIEGSRLVRNKVARPTLPLSAVQLAEVAGGAASAWASTPALAADSERQQLVTALERCGGNQTHAAKILGISRRKLVSRIAEHGLPRPRKRPC
jgi:DNA-binding NtrC family response regulator